MKSILLLALGGSLLCSGFSLRATVLWDGLLDPEPEATLGLGVSGGTLLGMQVTPLNHFRPQSMVGYIGMADRPIVAGRPPTLPTFSFTLWENDLMLGSGSPQFLAVGLMPSAFRTQSDLRVWSLYCDLSNLPWVLEAGRTYVIAATVDREAEWLVHNPVMDRALVNAGTGWEDLAANLGWNARLAVALVPEPGAATIVVVGSLLGFGVLRRFRRGEAA